MKFVRASIFIAAVVALPASAADWLLAKNPQNMNCYVVPADGFREISSKIIGRFPNQKAACEAAAKAYDGGSDVQENKCQAYNPNSTSECKRLGVELK
ncbi:hypothetical protein LJR039_007590 [Pseudorhodoferax sp. LjRoot39]|uniref:hypothetical protein n=1 Tax=Pseudorhodoferax sp. LjRoot39 TaxID=3342328 RepID=UPI003ECF42BD